MASVVIQLYLWGIDMRIKTRYRIVTDKYNGYEAQFNFWFIPFLWFQVDGCNTSTTIDSAERIIEKARFRKKVVKYID